MEGGGLSRSSEVSRALKLFVHSNFTQLHWLLLCQHLIHVYVHVCERGTYLYMYMYEREGSDLLYVCLLYVYVIYVYVCVWERDQTYAEGERLEGCVRETCIYVYYTCIYDQTYAEGARLEGTESAPRLNLPLASRPSPSRDRDPGAYNIQCICVIHTHVWISVPYTCTWSRKISI